MRHDMTSQIARIRKLRLEITNRCPFACAHCSVSAGPGRQAFMGDDGGRALIEQFAAQGGEDLVLTGGEPLEHFALFDFVKHGKDTGLRTSLFSMGAASNGEVVGRRLVRRLSDYLDVWTVSLHSATPLLHDALTHYPGSFKTTCVAVDRIVEAGVEVRCTFFAHSGNLGELTRVTRLCEQLRITELRIVVVVPQGRALSQASSFDVSGPDLLATVQEADGLGPVVVRLGEAAKAGHSLLNQCRAIQEELVVNWDGWISPCHSVEPYPSDCEYDNALLRPLLQVLENSPRLGRCRQEAQRAPQSQCESGCLARRVLIAEPATLPKARHAPFKGGLTAARRMPHGVMSDV